LNFGKIKNSETAVQGRGRLLAFLGGCRTTTSAKLTAKMTHTQIEQACPLDRLLLW